MKEKIPYALILFRFLAGFVCIYASYTHASNYIALAIAILILGFLSDIFDGIIARRLNVSTQHMRRMDSAADMVFFGCIVLATYLQHPEFFQANNERLILLFGTEALTYVICLIKFRKEIATHSLGAKLWSVLIVITIVQIIIYGESGIFTYCFYVGIISRLEIIAIVLILKKWTTDVPTFYHAILLRQGKEIKRHKLFNG